MYSIIFLRLGWCFQVGQSSLLRRFVHDMHIIFTFPKLVKSLSHFYSLPLCLSCAQIQALAVSTWMCHSFFHCQTETICRSLLKISARDYAKLHLCWQKVVAVALIFSKAKMMMMNGPWQCSSNQLKKILRLIWYKIPPCIYPEFSKHFTDCMARYGKGRL